MCCREFIRLNSIEIGKANITIKSINEEINPKISGERNDSTIEENVNSEDKTEDFYIDPYLAFALIIIAAIIIIILREVIKEKRGQ